MELPAEIPNPEKQKSKPKPKAAAKPKPEIPQRSVRVTYIDKVDKTAEVILPIPKEDYNVDISYRKNVEEIAAYIAEEGFFWASATTLIPLHRILEVSCVTEKTQKAEKPRGRPKKKHSRRKAANKPKPDTPNASESKEDSQSN